MEKGSLEGGGWVEEGLRIWDFALFLTFFDFFMSLLFWWATFRSSGMHSSNPGGKRGPDEAEDESVVLGLIKGAKVLESGIGSEGGCGGPDISGILGLQAPS